MTPFECYCLYRSLKLHYTSNSYCCIKYNWKVKQSLDSFNKRKDKIFFEKLSKHSNVKEYLIANFINNPKIWVDDLAYNSECERCYEQWLKSKQSLSYTFKQELHNLDSDFNKNFLIEDKQHPLLLKLYFQNEISFHTLCILVDMTKCFEKWDKEMNKDPLWSSIQGRIKKSIPLIDYDKSKLSKICIDFFS